MHPFMTQALALAQQSLTLSAPNPHVGCVIASADGQLLGQGFTQHAGGAHAEIMALRDAQAQGRSVLGATAYVTLEPCSHQGRTGPCCDALIQAGIAKVVASIADPNPRVAGQGFDRLRAAGITLEIGPGADVSRELNIGFFSRMIRQRPWVRLKIAASLDGKTALVNGASQWITGEAARADGHAWRARACAVLTGIGTVTFALTHADVTSTPDAGAADVPVPEVAEAMTNSTGLQLTMQPASGLPNNSRDVEWTILTPSAPASFSAALQVADTDAEVDYTTIDTATAVGSRQVAGVRANFIRIKLSSVVGGTLPTVIGKVLV